MPEASYTKPTTCIQALLLLSGIGASGIANPVPAVPDNALHGLTSVVVRYEGIDDELAPYGLNRDKLESSISALLGDAGIRVLPDRAGEIPSSAGTVTVKLRLQTTPYQFYLYNVNISLRTPLPLPAAGAYTTLETWSDGETGAIQPHALGKLQSTALQIVQRFVNDYAEQK